MTLRPGSAAWLLRHELRMYYFRLGGSAKGAARRGPGLRMALIAAGVTVAIHLLAWKLLSFTEGDGGGTPLPLLIMITVVMMLVFSLMLSHAFKGSIEVLFERGDLDLLLSSPVPSRSIFVVRLAAITVGTAGLYMFFLAPFAHAGLVLGQPRWLAVYPVVLGAAAVAASAAMLLTLALVRLLGVRRTRVVGQVLGALSGAFFFLLSQLYAHGGAGFQERVAGWLGAHAGPNGAFDQHSLLWLPARAVLGAPWPMLALGTLGIAAFFFTVHTTHGFFVRGLQQAVSKTGKAQRKAGPPPQRFGMGLTRTVLLKEWRTIMRDPQLISQVLLQMLYFLPMCFIFAFKAGATMPGTGASLVFLATSLTTALAWLVIAAEDAPDLLRASPAARSTVVRAKLAAAVMPSVVLLVVPVAWVALRAPAAAAFLLLCAVSGTLSAALVVSWCAQPAPRGDFQRRARGHPLSTFLEFSAAFACSGVAWIGLSLQQTPRHSAPLMAGMAALLLMLALALLLAWSRRDKTT
jgi:ABC-2 type transport system permease protein